MADDRNWLTQAQEPHERVAAGLAHLSAFVFPLIGPFVIWLIYRSSSRFVVYHTLQAIVFQGLVGVLTLLVGIASLFTCGALAPISGLLWLGAGLLVVYVSISAFGGDDRAYPGLEDVGRV